jgi:hypothetical protein
MSSLERQSGGLSRPMKDKLIAQLFPDDLDDDNVVQLTIRFAAENINVNELASYLGAIYKADGLLHGPQYRSYVHHSDQQIELTRIRSGSVLAEIERYITAPNAYNLGVLWLFLKYLPQAITKLTEIASNVIDVLDKREDYLEKRAKRKLRQDIKRVVADDPELVSLSEADKAKLVKLLGELYESNSTKMNAMVRFSKKYVKEITFKARRK